jgi:hypothetical protein
MIISELFTENNAVQIAILAGFFFFGDWIYSLIINNLKKRTHNSILGFLFALGIILLISSVPILLVNVILTNPSSSFGWILSAGILVACLIKYYMS